MRGHLRKRGDTWELRAYAGRDPVSNRELYRTRTFRGGKREAERALGKFVQEVADRGPEARDGIGFEGIGFYEVINSRWSAEIVRINKLNFPETPSDLELRHFIVACKENTLQVLARDFRIEFVDSLEVAWRQYFEAYR